LDQLREDDSSYSLILQRALDIHEQGGATPYWSGARPAREHQVSQLEAIRGPADAIGLPEHGRAIEILRTSDLTRKRHANVTLTHEF